ncbi:MAG TPA: glycosyltransferase [Verrucomicrobiae bacterium]|nr:glycosyltransferase [Verrucomicrobiae bacterium]
MNLMASIPTATHARASLAGVPIVCFAHDFEGDPTSKTHIMRLLARAGSRVLWVNSIGLRRPSASRGDARRIFDKVRRSVRGCREVEPNLFVTSPLALPLHGLAVADRFNRALLGSTLRRLCRRLDFDQPILWTFMPNVGGLLGACRERCVIYHCVDEYTAFSGVVKQAIGPMEEDLTRRAEVVFTSSERLGDERRRLNANVHFVPHGVDLDHFGRALDPTLPVPADLRDVPGPVIGFFGLIADWVDLDLVRAAALARPQWSFVLIGKLATAAEVLGGVPNVRLLGQKPYASLPSYCRGMDVGIIPFRTNTLTVRANPLKLREYLAAGLPVVSTPLPEVARYEGLVRLAGDLDGFLRAIEAGLEARSAEADRARAESMRGESWEARVREMERIVTSRLGATR